MVERPRRVVEPEEQRADQLAGAALVPAEARDGAVGRARMLDLDHHALPGLVRRALVLGDDPVEPGALEALEPILRHGAVAARRGEMDAASGPAERALQPRPALRLRPGAQVLVALRQEIEGDERRRRLRRQLGHPRGRRVEPQLEGVEVEPRSVAITISPSTTQRSGRAARSGAARSGK